MKPGLVAVILGCAQLMGAPVDPHGPAVSEVRSMVSAPSDIFQLPLPAWSPHCLGFGSEWRYCNGVPLRACTDGAVWLHTGTDVVASVGDAVTAAGDGQIIGYLVDPTFRGGVLIRHATTFGVVITQYWHVWLKSGFEVGSKVKRGEEFAGVADMGAKTHLHFAVFMGDFDGHTWNGALPPHACSGFPAFPYRFVDPTAFIQAHALEVVAVAIASVLRKMRQFLPPIGPLLIKARLLGRRQERSASRCCLAGAERPGS